MLDVVTEAIPSIDAARSLLPMQFRNVGPDFPPGIKPHMETLFGWGQAIVLGLGVLGILFAAGKMAVGKFGRSDLAADGVGSVVWIVFAVSLVLVAIPIVNTFFAPSA